MSDGDKAAGMKSAWELALERLDEQGIERPREGGLDPAIQEQIAELRQRSEAELAKLEILLQDRLKASPDPADQLTAREEYAADRRRLEDQRDRKIDKLRRGA
jgi:hypothetical protein